MPNGYNIEIERALNKLADSVGLRPTNKSETKPSHIKSVPDGKGNLVVTFDPINSDSYDPDTSMSTDAMKRALEGSGIEKIEIVKQYAKFGDDYKVLTTDPEEINKGVSNENENKAVFAAHKLIITVPNDKESLDKIENAHVNLRKAKAILYFEKAFNNTKDVLKPLGVRANTALDEILKQYGLQRVPEPKEAIGVKDKESLDNIENAHVKEVANLCFERAFKDANDILKPLGYRADKVLDEILKQNGLRRIPEKSTGK